jgi:peptide/nickel transport system ATP-binding protein
MSIITLQNVSKDFIVRKKSFSEEVVHVLHDVNIAIERDEIVALVGASGSGKSTIANLVLRIYDITKGEILYNGKDISKIKGKDLAEYRKHVQIIFQDPYSSLDPTRTVRWHIYRPLKIRGVNNIEEKIDSILEEVSLSPAGTYKNMFPYQLSGGLRQRVFIARALATDPDVLIADEPVSMLDASVKASILELLRELKMKRHLSVLYITHDLGTVNYLSDRVYIIEKGKIVEQGITKEVLKNPQNDYTKRLIQSAPDPYERILP